MRASVLTARLILGAWMLFWGLNYFVGFIPEPMGVNSHALRVAMSESGMFALAKAVEVALALSLLANRLVPLSLVTAFPITVIIAWIDLLIETSPVTNLAGGITFALHVFLLIAFLPYYRSMIAWQADPIDADPLRAWRGCDPGRIQPAISADAVEWH